MIIHSRASYILQVPYEYRHRRTSHLDFFLDYTYEFIIKWHFNQLIKVDVLPLVFSIVVKYT